MSVTKVVERAHCLDILGRAYCSLGETGGRIVMIHGEAGIGKTTAIGTFLQGLDPGQRVAIGHCELLATPRPLGAVRDVARMLKFGVETMRNDTDLFDGLLDLLLEARQPVIIVLEDLHWADYKSLDWLKFIGRRIAQLPVLLIGSFRDEEVDETHPLRLALGAIPSAIVERVALYPLTLDGVTALLEGSGLAPEEVHRITLGNAFFVTELVNGGASDHNVPLSVSDAVHARLSALNADLRSFLELVSCCPAAIPQDITRALVGDRFDDLVELSVRRHFLRRIDDTLEFRHMLARRAIYEPLSPTKRRDAHARYLAAYMASDRGDAELDSIVHHAVGAGDGPAVLKTAHRAAQIAAGFGAHREAALHYQSALDHIEGADETTAAKIYESFAYEAALALQIDDQVIAARRTAISLWRRLGRSEKVGENLAALSRVHWYRGEAHIAGDLIHEAIDILERQAPHAVAALAKSHALRAQFLMLRDRMEEAKDWAQRAAALAGEVSDHETLAHALNSLGSAMMFRGEREGEAHLRKSLSIALEHGCHEQAARAYTNLSECLIELRELDSASELIEEGIAFDTAHDLDAWTYYLVGRKGQLRFEQDRYEEAAMICEGVLDRDGQTLLMRMPAMLVLARSALRLGLADAADLLQAALSGAERIDEPQYLVAAHVAALEAVVLTGQPDMARPSLDWFDAMEPGLMSPPKEGEYLIWRQLLGANTADRISADLPKPFRLLVRGDYDAAAAALVGTQSRYLAGWALVLAGRLPEADALFAEARAKSARVALRRLSGDGNSLPKLARGPYSAARSHPYDLTAKEQTVLGLVVAGHSNAEIADAMSRSVRTVENHVSSILRKLGCDRRLEVALLAQSEPWILPAPEN